jgi:hypothetical protein
MVAKNIVAAAVTGMGVLGTDYNLFVKFGIWVGNFTFLDNFRDKIVPIWWEWALPMLTTENLVWVCLLGGAASLVWINFGDRILAWASVLLGIGPSGKKTLVDADAQRIEAPSSYRAGRPTVAQGPPRIWRPQGLYVGQINVTTDQLASNLVSNVVVSGFNATECDIIFERVSGNIIFRKSIQDSDEKCAVLPTPEIQQAGDRLQIVGPSSSFILILEQRFTREAEQDFSRSFQTGGQVYLGLEQLKVLAAVHGNPDENTTLPLWSGVTVSKGGERPVTGKAAKGSSVAVSAPPRAE